MKGLRMSSEAAVTVVKMIESLPASVQVQVVEHLRDYIGELQDELQWDTLFQKTQHQLVAAARKATNSRLPSCRLNRWTVVCCELGHARCVLGWSPVQTGPSFGYSG